MWPLAGRQSVHSHDSFRVRDQPFSIASPTLNVVRCTANRRGADLAGGIVDVAVGSILEVAFSLLGISRIQGEVSRRVYLLASCNMRVTTASRRPQRSNNNSRRWAAEWKQCDEGLYTSGNERDRGHLR